MVSLTSLPDPAWPVLVLAVVQLTDGILCVKPAAFIARCLEDVAWPRELWWLMPTTKIAAAAGLTLGIWVPFLGLAATVGVIAYFVAAITLHVRAKDFGRNLFVNAGGMLALSVAALLVGFVESVQA
jgi:hypothetical protein